MYSLSLSFLSKDIRKRPLQVLRCLKALVVCSVVLLVFSVCLVCLERCAMLQPFWQIKIYINQVPVYLSGLRLCHSTFAVHACRVAVCDVRWGSLAALVWVSAKRWYAHIKPLSVLCCLKVFKNVFYCVRPMLKRLHTCVSGCYV